MSRDEEGGRKSEMNFLRKAIHGVFFRIKCLFEFIFFKTRFIYMRLRCRKTYAKLKQFKDIHKGERCFLIGTGPSLTDEDVLKLRGEYTFAVNSFIHACKRLDFYPTYYGEIDYDKFDLPEILDNNKSTIFFTHRIDMPEKVYRRMDKKENTFEFLMMEPGNWNYFSRHMPMPFSDDITRSIGWGYTVVYSMYQIIAYMGFSEIYVLGMDCSYSMDQDNYEDHYTKEARETVTSWGEVVNNFIKSHTEACWVFKTKGVKVYNTTRGGRLEVFPRVDLDAVLQVND